MTTQTDTTDTSAMTAITPLENILLDTGVGALLDGHPIAVFRLAPSETGQPDELYAIDGIDPFTQAPVLSRGLVGSEGDQSIVASPLHKQRFDLATGQSLDDENVAVTTYPVAVVDGMVFVGSPASSRS